MNAKFRFYLFSLLLAGFAGFFIRASFTEDDKLQKEFESYYKIYALSISDNLTFAGEKVPITDFDVKERYDRELLTNVYWQSQTLLILKRANRFFPSIQNILKKNNKPIVFFSGHFANFELMAKCLQELGFNIGAIYRPLNNIFLNPIMEFIRKKYICPIQIEKGSNGTKKLIKHIASNNPLALMIDQRLSSSIRVPFFNQPATTTTTPAQLALKYDALLVPVFLKRLKKTHFEFFIEEPLVVKKTNDYEKDIFNITQIMNKKIEEFIKIDPSSWLWSHDRWK